MPTTPHEMPAPTQHLALLATGVPGLDTVLGGGFPAHHLYMVQGLAGSGKTTLACQIGFHHARQGGKVLVLTLIAESHARLLQHLANFSFYDEALVGSEMLFFAGYPALANGGLRELLGFISACLDQHHPEIMIIDGFRTVRDAKPTDLALSEFMHSLNALVSTMGCTTFLLSPVEGNIAESENTLVDGLVELSQFQDDVRLIRELKVFKARGCNHLLGKHAFEVAGDGLAVYPRLEATATRANAAAAVSGAQVGSGIPDWDRITGGGVMEGSNTCLLGTPGVGKTIMGLHFLHQAMIDNEPCLMLGFYESPARVLQKARKVGLDLAAGVDDGRVEMIWNLPLEIPMDRLAQDLLENIDRRKVTRLFIDGVEGFNTVAAHRARIRPFLIALMNELRVRNVTTIISQELPYFSQSYAPSDSSASVLYENIMLLQPLEVEGVSLRLISVMKLRESDYDPARHVMSISGRGIAIDGPLAASVTRLRQHQGARQQHA